ncbi:hypothetical protein AAVH_22192 [Aphelenchoides avenae]|nr:hypothetical protein AAVH_22192 [Aphelenchus avenae]
MLFGEFAERGKDVVELKDVDAADFQCFKDVTHPLHASVDGTNIASVVYTTDKFRAASHHEPDEPTDAFKVPGRCD